VVTNNGVQESQPHRNRKKAKIQESLFRDKTNVGHEMYDHTGNNGANGIVTKVVIKNMEAIAGRHSIDSIHKAAILGTSHIIRKFLQCETERWG
jgi:hypothetical protein